MPTPTPTTPLPLPLKDVDFTIGTHISRAFTCQISLAKTTEYEEKAFDEKKNVKLKALRSYYIWRRSSLLVAMPFIFCGNDLWLDRSLSTAAQ